jgi:arylsulfatase
MDKGRLVYLYNMMIIEQYSATSAAPIAPGRHKIDVVTDIAGPGKAGTATLIVDGKEVGRADLARTVPLAFTASETFDVGIDLGAPVAAAYEARRPFAFNGTIRSVRVALTGH